LYANAARSAGLGLVFISASEILAEFLEILENWRS
jgi:hypothetical protein